MQIRGQDRQDRRAVDRIVGYINCRITYDKLGFTAKNFLGIKRHFTYDQITGIRFGIQETHIYVGKHRYMVDDIAVGGSEFLAFASKRYQAVSNRRSIPEVHKSGFDLFRGNIRNPGYFLFLYILIGALALGVLIYFVCDIYVPSTPDNTLKEDLYFQSLTVEEDTLIFDALNGKIYKLSFIDESIDIQALRAVCDGETALRVYSREYTPKDKAPRYSVKAIMLREQPILDFEESNRLYRQEYWPMLLLFGGFCLFWGIYVAASIAVGRNPKKYSRKTVKRFFKEEYLKY